MIKLTKENIEYGIKSLKEIESRMRLEKVTSFLFESGKIIIDNDNDNGQTGLPTWNNLFINATGQPLTLTTNFREGGVGVVIGYI